MEDQCKEMQAKIKKAQSLVGKYFQRVIRKGYAVGEVKTWNVAFKGDAGLDSTISKYLESHDYCVYISYNSRDIYYMIIDDIELYKAEHREILIESSRLNVLVYPDRIVIGSHVIPQEKVQEIVKTQNDLRNGR